MTVGSGQAFAVHSKVEGVSTSCFRGVGFRVQGSGFRVQRFRVQGLGFALGMLPLVVTVLNKEFFRSWRQRDREVERWRDGEIE